MPVINTKHNREFTVALATTAVLLGIYALTQHPIVQDIWKGWQYQESSEVGEIRKSLELTNTGERIFLATQPAIESADDFNEHCDSHQADVSLLGCYTNDKIYIYGVQAESLQDSKKVTAAHELLHAVWLRMGRGERDKIESLLYDVKRDNQEWVEAELSLYKDNEQMEELYTRVGTKLRDIPGELERHYAKYFTNRQKIVDYYENYQAPFEELKARNAELKQEIDQLNAEIATERRNYENRISVLDQKIKEFNRCADTEGCFASRDSFQAQRERIEAERISLDRLRESLNEKIDRNNKLVSEYQENQESLGELNNALNSNLERIYD